MSAPQPKLHVAEPPAVYLARAPLVVDCSVLSAMLFQEDTRDDARRVLGGRALHAPHLLDHEIISVAIKKGRSGCPEPVVGQALASYLEQDIELHRTAVQEQHQLAHRYRLSAYDAAYLLLAAELRAPLATFDAKLAAAAQIHLASLL